MKRMIMLYRHLIASRRGERAVAGAVPVVPPVRARQQRRGSDPTLALMIGSAMLISLMAVFLAK